MSKATKTKGKKDWSLFLATLVSGVLYALAFPPLNLFFLVGVALVPWLVVLKGKTTWQGFKSGYGFGMIFWATQMFWLVPFVQKWTNSLGTALIPYAAVVLLPPLYFAFVGMAMQRCLTSGRTWMIPLVWAGMEWCRSYVPYLRFPWGLIATPLANFPMLIQPAAIGTVFLVSAWVVLVNVLFVEIGLKSKPLAIMRTVLIASAVGAGSAAFFTMFREEGTRLKVAAAQPGIDLAFGPEKDNQTALLNKVNELYAQADAKGLDLVVFPEAMADIQQADEMKELVSVGKTPVVIGATRGSKPAHQSSLSIADGQVGVADKTELVIFGEYVPLRDQLPFLKNFNLPNSDLEPGTNPNVLTAGKVKVGPILCFEALFPNVSAYMANHGAQVLACQSIDDWYKGTWAVEQLELSSRFRAVECQLPMIRAASTGTSMLISRTGEVFASKATGEGLLEGEVNVMNRSLAFIGREYFGWVFAASWLVALVMPVRKKK